MGKKIVILPGALSDMEEAAQFYDQQEPGLGSEVYDFLKQQITQLAVSAGIHPGMENIHRWVVGGRFPYYLVYYRLVDDQVTVAAILDARCDPAHHQNLLSERLAL